MSSDEVTGRYMPPELRAAAALTKRRGPRRFAPTSQFGAAAALHTLMVAAAKGADHALILSGDPDGLAAAAVWARAPR